MTRHTRTPSRLRASHQARFTLRPLSLAAMLMLGQVSWALPTGGTVVYGNVQTTQTSSTSVNITQTSNKAYVQYDSFSIEAGERVSISQLSSSSVFVGQVTGFDASRIMGQLQANGQVFLINPNGIVFGATAQVDVGSLVATTMGLSLNDFLADRYLLQADASQGQGELKGQVQNLGRIQATGSVVLAGHQVLNAGEILADGGRVGMVAADKVLVDVEGDGLLFFEVEGDTAGTRLAQLGRIQADGGSVELRAEARGQFADTVLNLSGVVQARTLGMRAGQVVIDGGSSGITQVTGQIDATGQSAGQHGGSVSITGERVGLFDQAVVDVSGAAGGGQIRVGGDWHGEGSLRTATETLVGSQVQLKADATAAGSGGSVVVWSDDVTRFWGSISAQGGSHGGDGGQVEVSAKGWLDYEGLVDLRAAAGSKGSLLLDPRNIAIVDSNPDINNDNTTGDDLSDSSFNATSGSAASTSEITAGAVVAQLDLANVTLTASNNITVSTAIDASGNTGLYGLTLSAGQGITINANITTLNGLSLTGTLSNGISLGADVTLDAGAGQLSLGKAVAANDHSLTLISTQASATAIQTGGNLSSLDTLTVNGQITLGGNVTSSGTQSYTDVVSLTGDRTLNAGAGKIALSSVSGGTHALTLSSTSAAADAISTSGAITGVTALSVQGKATLGGDVTTTGTQSYTGTLTLTGDTQLASGAAKVSLAGVAGGAHALTVVSANAAADAIKTSGSITDVSTLSMQGKTTLGGDVTTTGNQTYTGGLTLASTVRLDAGASQLSLDAVSGAYGLTLVSTSAAADAIALHGAVSSLTTLDVQGRATLAASVTTTGKQTYSDTLTLAGNLTLDAGAGRIELAAVDAASHNLTLASTNSAADAISLGSALTNLADLTVQGKATVSVDVTSAGAQSYADTLTTSGDRQFQGSSLSFTGLSAGTSNLVLTADQLAVTGTVTGSGAVTLLPLTGTVISLAGGAPVASGTLQLSQAVLSEFASFSGLTIGSASQAYTIKAGALTLPTDVTLRTLGGDVTLAAVDGAHALDVATTGAITVGGDIGATTRLTSLSLSGPVTLNAGAVNTTGAMLLDGAVTLGADTSLDAGGSTLHITGAVSGAGHDLTLTSSAGVANAVALDGAVSLVDAFAVQGRSTLGGNVTSTSDQTYAGAVTLTTGTTLDAGAGRISLAGVAGGGFDLTLKSTASGTQAITTSASLTQIATLDVQGGATLGGNVTTTGNQTYSSTVTLDGQAVTLQAAGRLSVAGAIDGDGQNLTLISGSGASDAIVLGAAVNHVADLLVQGAAQLGGDVTTTGTQHYTSLVTLTGDTTFTASGLSVLGDLDVASHNLGIYSDAFNVVGSILNPGSQASVAGSLASTTIGVAGGTGTLQLTQALMDKFSGFGTLTVGRVDGSGTITFGDFTLTRNLGVQTGSGQIELGALDGAYRFTATSDTGTVRFNGVVGGTTALSGLTVNADARINTSQINTVSGQSYGGDIILAADTALSASSISVQGDINGAHALTMTANGTTLTIPALGTVLFVPGVVALGGEVGALTPLTSLTTTGATSLSGNVTTTVSQTYHSGVTLLADVSFESPSLSFSDTLSAGSYNLGVLADTLSIGGTLSGTGTAQIAPYTVSRGIVVSGSSSGGELVVDASTFSQFASFGSLTIGRADGTGSVVLGSAGSAFTLPADLTLQSGTGNIQVLSSIDGAHSLSLLTGGVTSLQSSIGTSTALTSLTTDATGSTHLAGSVYTSGAQHYGDAVIVDGLSALQASAIQFDGTVNGPSSLYVYGPTTFAADVGGSTPLASLYASGPVTFEAGGAKTSSYQYYVGAVGVEADSLFSSSGAYVYFGSTLDGAHAVSTSSASGTYFNSVVGGSAALTSLTVTGTARVNTAQITTTGDQTYHGPVLLGANVTLSGDDVVMGSTVDGAYQLVIDAAGLTTLNGIVGGTTALSSVTVSGPLSLGAAVTTSGAQRYEGAVTLTGNVTLTAAGTDFMSTVDGAHALSLVDSGVTTFHADVGQTQALSSLSTTVGGSTVLPARVHTTGAQSYADTVVLSADTVLQANSVSLSALTGAAHGLTVDTLGTLTFNGAISNLASLDKQGSGVTRFTASATGLSTPGAQHYGGAVEVVGNALFDASALTFDAGISGATNLTLSSDAIQVTGSLAGTGVLTLMPKSVATTIGLSGGAGDLQIDLSAVSGFTQRVIGRSDGTGAITVGNAVLTGDTTLQSGSGVISLGTLDGAYDLTVNTTGTTTFSGNVGDVSALSSLTVAGPVQMDAASLRTSGAQLFSGAVTVSGPLALSASTVTMTTANDLTLSSLSVSSGDSVIHTPGVLTLAGDVTLSGGTLTLQADAAAGSGRVFTDAELAARAGLTLGAIVLKEADAAIDQTAGLVTTAAGSTLNLLAPNRGSILLDHTVNNLAGNVSAISGPAGDTDASRFTGGGTLPLSFVRIDSQQIHAAGIEADVVKLSANSLNTVSGTKIRARLPYINAQGIETSIPALTLVLKEPTVLNQFGSSGSSSWIQVDLGDAQGGFLTVRPQGAGAGASAVYLGGPEDVIPFYDGSGKTTEIQVYYNGMVPSTPQEVGALSAVTSVIEEARRSRFDEAVRTENVSSRLRTGVIAEVGSGRPATEGGESIRMPESCQPRSGLSCQ